MNRIIKATVGMRRRNWLAAVIGAIIFVFTSELNLRAEADSKAYIVSKLDRIILRNVKFKDMPFREALKYLQSRSVELDVKESRKGINFLILANSGKGEGGDTLVTLEIGEAPLGIVLSYTVAHARMEYKINHKGVVIVPYGTKARDEAEEEIRREAFVAKKLKGIILPSVEFHDTPLHEALKILQEKSAEFDVKESNPAKKGVEFVVRPSRFEEVVPIESDSSRGGFGGVAEAPITLKLSHVPLATALKYTVSLAQMRYKVEPPVVRLYTLSSHGEGTHSGLYTNTYIVPPNFLSGAHGEADSPKGKTLKDILIGIGVKFTPGTSAIFNPATSSIIVRNTWDQMKLIETYVESINGRPMLDWH